MALYILMRYKKYNPICGQTFDWIVLEDKGKGSERSFKKLGIFDSEDKAEEFKKHPTTHLSISSYL